MTGRVEYTPEAYQQLDDLDEWITERASSTVARSFVRAVMDHCEAIPIFPLAGRERDDVRPGMRTTSDKKRTLIAYRIDDSTDELVIHILGIFHGGQDWEPALREESADPGRH